MIPPPTATGLPRSSGSSRCSTEAKNASASACRIVVPSDTNTCSHIDARLAGRISTNVGPRDLAGNPDAGDDGRALRRLDAVGLDRARGREARDPLRRPEGDPEERRDSGEGEGEAARQAQGVRALEDLRRAEVHEARQGEEGEGLAGRQAEARGEAERRRPR